MTKKKWSVVTIQECDGHVFDGIFLTDDEGLLKKFSKELWPLTICASQHLSKKDAIEFYFDICDGFVNITPNSYTDFVKEDSNYSMYQN